MIMERSADKYLYTNMIFQEHIMYYTITGLYKKKSAIIRLF